MEVSQAELDVLFQEYRAAEVRVAHFVFSIYILDRSVQSAFQIGSLRVLSSFRPATYADNFCGDNY